MLVVAVLGGLAVGRLRSPMGARGVRLHVRRLPLLAVGAFGSALSQLLDGDLATLALGASLVTLLAFVAANMHITGVFVIGCGLLLNLVAVVLNNGMPVRGGALVAAGVVDEGELAGTTFGGSRHLESSSDRLAMLGDVLPIPLSREVLSFGDLIVVAGAADAMRELSRRRQPAWAPSRRQDYRATSTQLSIVQDWGTSPSGIEAPDTIDLTEPPAPRARPLVAAHSPG